jgi:hypothetical protein
VKNFYTAQDIEDLATQGKRELVLDDDTVLTDLGRHMADQLGIAITTRDRPSTSTSASAPSLAAPSVPVSGSAPRAPLSLGSKPKGCQHGPLPPRQLPDTASAAPPSNSAAYTGSNTVVDQLVGLVKRLGGKGPAQ